MNREIEFRGKVKRPDGVFCSCTDKNDGEWVFGDLEVRRKDGRVLIHLYNADGGYYRQYDVDSDTVGQFTGLRDKNGRKIYEGDIISFVDGLKQVNGEWIDNEHIYSVEYSEASFKGVCGLSKCLDAVEVIGNIYDNQDLLYKK